MCRNICICQKIFVPLRCKRKAIHKTLTIMLQTQTYSQVLNMACLLSLAERKRLIRDVQVRIAEEEVDAIDMLVDDSLLSVAEGRTYTQAEAKALREKLIASVEEGEQEIERGEFYTNEEVLARMQERISNYEKMAV